MKSLQDFLRGKLPPSESKVINATSATYTDTYDNIRTLASNTGYDSQFYFECGVDWLDITFRNVASEEEIGEIISELEAIASESIDYSLTKPVFNGRTWHGSGHGLRGTRIWYDEGQRDVPGLPDVPRQLKIAMSGSVLRGVDFPILADWLSWRAARNDLDCTRIDICVDDKHRCVNLGQITQAMMTKNFFNATKRGLQMSDDGGDALGVTVYFGSPTSHKRLRIYDKYAESGGKIGGVRWEAQFRKTVARDVLFNVLEKIDESIEATTTYFSSLVTGIIDFRDRAGNDPNRFRCPILDWFRRFCDALRASPIRMIAEVPEPLVQRSIDWVQKSVAQSLSLLEKVLKDDYIPFINNIIKEGGEKLNNRKRQLINNTDRDKLLYSV